MKYKGVLTMEMMSVNELREKHEKERKAKAKIVAKKKRELIEDIQFMGGIILGILAAWFIITVFFTI